jgi:hypothetical protein
VAEPSRTFLPALGRDGDLPSGIYSVSLRETLRRFGKGSRQRIAVAQRLERIYRLAVGTGHLARFVVFGSFVSAKREPADVDVFLLMENGFDVSVLSGEARILFDHPAAQAHFGASVFWLRRLAVLGDEEQTITDWQVKRDGTRRGVIEIVEESA